MRAPWKESYGQPRQHIKKQRHYFANKGLSSQMKVKSLSRARLFVTPWMPSMGFSRQEYWSGLPFPSPADFPNPGIKPGSPAKTDALPSEPPGKPCLVKAMVFPVVMYGCENWTVKKAEGQIIDTFELWCWRRLLRVPWTARRSIQSILKEISPGCSLEGLMLKLKLQHFGHLMWRSD